MKDEQQQAGEETPQNVQDPTAAVLPTGANPIAEQTKRAARRPKPKPQIESVEELVKFAYESNARLLEFSKESLRKIPITDEAITSQGDLILALVPTDPTLASPYKMLQYVARQGVPLNRSQDSELTRALNRLVELSVQAMSHSPVFRIWTEHLRDPRREPELSPQHVRDEARRVDADRLGLNPDQFKPADSDRLVHNAVACYALLRTLQDEWNLDRFIDESYAHVWRHETPEAIGVQRAVGHVGASRDQDVLGIVGENFIARITRLQRRIATLEQEANVAQNSQARIIEQFQAAREKEHNAIARAEAFSADIVRLRRELAVERDSRVVDNSHMADDYETLRTRIIRRLSGEIDLLTDGLHALRNGAPDVADEFLDRSLLALTREVDQLKDATGGPA